MKKILLSIIMIAAIPLFFSCDGDSGNNNADNTGNENKSPSVSIDEQEQSIDNGAALTLNALANDPDGDSLTYQWSVDGAEEAGQTSSSFVFARSPAIETVYEVKVAVSDSSASASASVVITVKAPVAGNTTPTVTIAEPSQTINGGQALVLHANAQDADGDALLYQWVVNDNAQMGETASSFEFLRAPAIQTSYTVKIYVTDTKAVTSASVVITVRGSSGGNHAPTVTITEPSQTINYGQYLTLHADAGDPDGDTIYYSWSVDGVDQTGQLNSQFVFSRRPAVETSYVVTVRVNDTVDFAEASVTVTVREKQGNQAPSVGITAGSHSAMSGQTVNIEADAYDPDGDDLYYQWYVDGAEQAGETSDSFSFSRTPSVKTTYNVSVAVTDNWDTTYADIDIKVYPVQNRFKRWNGSAWANLSIYAPTNTIEVFSDSYYPDDIFARTVDNHFYISENCGSFLPLPVNPPEDCEEFFMHVSGADAYLTIRTSDRKLFRYNKISNVWNEVCDDLPDNVNQIIIPPFYATGYVYFRYSVNYSGAISNTFVVSTSSDAFFPSDTVSAMYLGSDERPLAWLDDGTLMRWNTVLTEWENYGEIPAEAVQLFEYDGALAYRY